MNNFKSIMNNKSKSIMNNYNNNNNKIKFILEMNTQIIWLSGTKLTISI